MMTRRDAFSKFRNPPSPDAKEGEHPIQQGDHVPDQPLDLIPTAQPRNKRSRNWERTHRCETVTYRGVPLEYHQLLGKIAGSLCVPRDEVVRAFLEHSITLYRQGQLTILAHPKAQRMTLFPGGEKSTAKSTSQIKENSQWLAQAFPTPIRKRSSIQKKDRHAQGPQSRWETRVTYRLPLPLKTEIKTIAVEYTLPVGEVVWFFIEQAIKDYHSGSLVLEPALKTVGKTLFRE